MSRVDTAWLRMDTDINLMMIVGVWLLQPAIRCEALVERIRQRLLPYPRFRERVAQGALASNRVADDNFDLARHVVIEKLPRRRGQTERAALQRRMGELASSPLDHAHPLWQFHFIARYEGGSALICRIHHCIGDGVALNSVVMSIADDGATPPQLAQHDAGPHPGQAGQAAQDAHQGDWVSEACAPSMGANLRGGSPLWEYRLLRPTINSNDQFTLFEGERSAVSHSCMG